MVNEIFLSVEGLYNIGIMNLDTGKPADGLLEMLQKVKGQDGSELFKAVNIINEDELKA